jgi:hypothetical protein
MPLAHENRLLRSRIQAVSMSHNETVSAATDNLFRCQARRSGRNVTDTANLG